MKQDRVFRKGLTGLLVFATSLTLSALVTTLISATPTAAEDPPRPTQRIVSSFPVTAPPAQYELVEQVLDFAPGAATRLHQHGGRAYVTVIEGQVVFKEGARESVYGAGQSYVEEAGSFHTLTNRGSTRARIFITVLLSPGQAQVLAHPDSAAPAIAPTIAFLGRTVLGTQPAEFTLTQAVVDFAPGALQPRHHHGGPGLLIVMDGELLFRTDAGARTLKPGDTFLDVGAAHDARNETAKAATTVVTFLIKKGESQTTFLDTTAAAPATGAQATGISTGIRPPSTGDAGLVVR